MRFEQALWGSSMAEKGSRPHVITEKNVKWLWIVIGVIVVVVVVTAVKSGLVG